MKVDGGLIATNLADVPARARALEAAGYECTTTEAVECRVANRPGELARICEALGNEEINVDCCYGSASGQGGTLFFACDNAGAARPIIERLTRPTATARAT
jgi:hypothetical protein